MEREAFMDDEAGEVLSENTRSIQIFYEELFEGHHRNIPSRKIFGKVIGSK